LLFINAFFAVRPDILSTLSTIVGLMLF
jgi:hypothetical protein